MSKPLYEYLLIKRDANGGIVVNEERLKEIKQKLKDINGNHDREYNGSREKSIETLINQLSLIKDEFCSDCLNKCFSAATLKKAEKDIKTLVENNTDILSKIPIDQTQTEVKTAVTSSTSVTTNISTNHQNKDSLDKIICIIQKKSTKDEVNDFLKEFLFSQINENSQNCTKPISDGKTYELPRNCMLDLFIRQQIKDRGRITSAQGQTKYLLVESIRLTDEFDSWTFDHFHGLLDYWLVLDSNSQISFPNSWTLNPNAEIGYLISNKSIGDTNNSLIKHIERPNTKSLESFIVDICKIENNNNMSSKWYEALAVQENIRTYAHLTNLNQKEWERIKQLPMNALKTIKFYIDQEKQLVEQRKIQEIHQDESYSKAEIRANLHMIKLYFIRQLEHIEGIKPIPRLDSYCVEQAFVEMREEGYEDDGLFDQMKLFFQPLTVTDNELAIDENDLFNIDDADGRKKKLLDTNIQSLKQNFEGIDKHKIKLIEEIEEIKKQRKENYDNREKKLKDESAEQQYQLNKDWSKEDDRLRAEMISKKEDLKKVDEQLQDIESERMSSEQLLEIIQKNILSTDRTIDRKLVKPHRGFIMYGPPGTGKSVIMSKLAKKIGIAMLGPPLAAGELERPLVGQSEAIILDLCMRGNRLPHLMCCVSIDEIDSLAPKRDQDSSEGKVAKISVLLSVIEGIKDVPNLMFFSATNRLHMMDEAFLRRMSGKFFVGRPSARARKRILDVIPKIILDARIKTKLGTATTNFSGAALKSLTSAITVDYIAEKRLNKDFQMTEEQTLILADRTARQYQLYLGTDTLPQLILDNLSQKRLSNTDVSKQYHLPDNSQFTGKIIVSLRDKSVRIEATNQRRIIEQNLTETEENLQQLLERLTSYGNDRNVQLIQLIDLNLLSSQSAHDEKKIFETLKERYDECMQYKRSMIIYDLDSLIGVSKNESESSMGTSVSSSIVNQSIYTYVTNRFREAKIEVSNEKKTMSTERWAIAVVRDLFLLRKFTTDVDFTLTEQQKKEEEEEYERANKVKLCVKCRESYVENENRMGTCNYHDGFLYDNLQIDSTIYSTSQVIDILNQEEYTAYKDPTKKDEIERKKSRFKYICCHATFQVGGGHHGCRKDKHGYEESQINQQTNITEKELISEWEDVCIFNVEYNQQLRDLIKNRNLQQSSNQYTAGKLS